MPPIPVEAQMADRLEIAAVLVVEDIADQGRLDVVVAAHNQSDEQVRRPTEPELSRLRLRLQVWSGDREYLPSNGDGKPA
jgi:hypothetical protein